MEMMDPYETFKAVKQPRAVLITSKNRSMTAEPPPKTVKKAPSQVVQNKTRMQDPA